MGGCEGIGKGIVGSRECGSCQVLGSGGAGGQLEEKAGSEGLGGSGACQWSSGISLGEKSQSPLCCEAVEWE